MGEACGAVHRLAAPASSTRLTLPLHGKHLTTAIVAGGNLAQRQKHGVRWPDAAAPWRAGVRRGRECPLGMPGLMLHLVLRISGGGGASSSDISLGGSRGGAAAEATSREVGTQCGKADWRDGRAGKGIPTDEGGVSTLHSQIPLEQTDHAILLDGGTAADETGMTDKQTGGEGSGEGAGIEIEMRRIKRQRTARRSAQTRKNQFSGAKSRPKHSERRGGDVGPGISLAEKWQELQAPTRTLRVRQTAVNYEESDSLPPARQWSAEHSMMSDDSAQARRGRSGAKDGTKAGTEGLGADSGGRLVGILGVGRRRKSSGADKDANPLGQELSDSVLEERAVLVEESEGARKERRKRQLQHEAEEEAEEAAALTANSDGSSKNMTNCARAFRRRLIRQHWGESPEPPPVSRREYTFEEDLAVFRDAEQTLREACDRGNVPEATTLLSCGAVMEEWANCTGNTTLTLFRAMRDNGIIKSKRTQMHFNYDSSQEDDMLLHQVLADLDLDCKGCEVSAADARLLLPTRARAEQNTRSGSVAMESSGRVGEAIFCLHASKDTDDRDATGDESEALAWREGDAFGQGSWGPMPLPREEDVSAEGEPFLDCQITGALRGELTGNERGYRKYERECREYFANEFPDHRVFKLTDDKDKVGAFTPGEEDCEGVTESEERLWAEVPDLFGWIDPLGRRMQKIEMAMVCNATTTLNEEEREAIIYAQAPCMKLQDLMSQSEDSFDTKELLVIPKKTTEITTMEIDPFDKMQTKLSSTVGRKDFDFVDALGGFERVGAQIGVRGADQTYNARRARFMNAKKGSYKGAKGGMM